MVQVMPKYKRDKELKFWETPKFRTLNKKWHDKLESLGFYDMEEFDSPMELMKTHENERFRIKFTGDEFIARQRYYELAGQLLHSYKFESESDRQIWKLHSEGVSERAIAREYGFKHQKVKNLVSSLKKRIVKE
jgi:hypothetical protein